MKSVRSKAVSIFILSLLGFPCIQTSHAAAPLSCSVTAEPRQGQAVLPVHCSLELQGGTPPFTYSWDFDAADGIQIDKYHADPYFVYGYAGDYVITATVTDRFGESATDTVHVKVLPGSFIKSQPLELNSIHGSKDNPYIVEGLEISNPSGGGIRMEFCSHIIIRNCWFHHVTHPDSLNEGMNDAVLIAKSSDILIENCLFTNNCRGILADAWDDYEYNYNITVRNCVVKHTSLDHGIHVKHSDGVKIYNNVLYNNGVDEFFQHHRISGIACWASHNIDVHDNLVVGSSSDGICIGADNMLIGGEDPDFVTENFEIYRNTCRENGEMGIWFSVGRNGDVYENYAADSNLCGINFEYKISDSKIHHNFLRNNQICGININQSFNNKIYENRITEPLSGWGAIWVDSQKQLKIHHEYPVRTNHNIIRNNIAYNSRHGIIVSDGDSTYILNNTIHACGPHHRNDQAGITIDSLAGYSVIKNNIISDNEGYGIVCYNDQKKISYNDLWNNSSGHYYKMDSGTGDLHADPVFENISTHNYFLSATSPCIDAGDPSDSFENEPPPNGGRINMGAHGNTLYAAFSPAQGIDRTETLPASSGISENHPNPFNSDTQIRYRVSKASNVSIMIYDLLGRKCRTLIDQELHTAGIFNTFWDGTSEKGKPLPSGIYFIRFSDGFAVQSQKILLAR